MCENSEHYKTGNFTYPLILHINKILTVNKMNRYHFNVTINGVKFKVNVNANNSVSAYGKVKRTYPMASNITLIRAERVWNRSML